MQPTKDQSRAIAQIKQASDDNKPVGWFGSVRAGKTTGGIIAFIDYLEDNGFPPSLMVSFTYTLIERNLIPPVLKELQDRGHKPKVVGKYPPKIEVATKAGDFVIYCASAYDETSRRGIQGLTLGAAFLDEVVLYPQSFVMEVVARLSLEKMLLLMTANKLRPSHWIKTQWIDTDKIATIESHTSDNPHISKSTLSRYETLFIGHYKDTMLGNVWAGDGNFICPKIEPIETYECYQGNIWVVWINLAGNCSLIGAQFDSEGGINIWSPIIDAHPEHFKDGIYDVGGVYSLYSNKPHEVFDIPSVSIIEYDEAPNDIAEYCGALQLASVSGILYSGDEELRNNLKSWSWEDKDKPEKTGISSSCFAVAYAVYHLMQKVEAFESTEFDK